jgi:hypothetical protein
VETVSGHLAALRTAAPALLPYFIRMTEETTRLAVEKGSITREQAGAMHELLRTYERDMNNDRMNG